METFLGPKTLTGALGAHPPWSSRDLLWSQERSLRDQSGNWSCGGSSLEIKDNPGAMEGYAGTMQGCCGAVETLTGASRELFLELWKRIRKPS